jgi:hypothetical protein
MKCSICGMEIPKKGTWTQGNNAEPINSGRCCDYCNLAVVLPARVKSYEERTGKKWK